jgi:hypothetical protein
MRRPKKPTTVLKDDLHLGGVTVRTLDASAKDRQRDGVEVGVLEFVGWLTKPAALARRGERG